MFTTFNSVKKVVHGCGTINYIGQQIENMGGTRVVVVTTEGVTRIGLHKNLCESLDHSDLEYLIYNEAELEPHTRSISRCAERIIAFRADVIVGFGGSSVLDTVKAAAVLVSNGGEIKDYAGVNMVKQPCKPLVLVPITAGSGGEMTSVSVLTDEETGGKLSVVSDYLYATLVILDPELTVGLPPSVTAMAGVDAFVRAMESFVGNRATAFTDALNLQAMKMISANIRRAYKNGFDLEAREQMLYGSALADLGFGNTRASVTHAVDVSVPGGPKLPGGLLIKMRVPLCVESNYAGKPRKYAQMRDILLQQDESDEPLLYRAKDCERAFHALLEDLNITPGPAAPCKTAAGNRLDKAQSSSFTRRLIGNNSGRGDSSGSRALPGSTVMPS